jgi:flagellin
MVQGAYSTNQATASAAAGSTVANGYAASTGAVASGGAFRWDSGDKALVAGIDVSTGLSFAVDAKKIADNINSSTNLQNAGISARASNTSTAAAGWSDIQVGTGQSLQIKFFVGTDSSADITISVGAGQVLTLSDLVAQINSQASANGSNITAKADNNKLVLTTQGETIGLEVSVSAAAPTSGTSTISVDMAQFLGLSSTGQNVSATATTGGAASATGSAIQVGKLVIMGTDQYNYDFTGITTSSAGLGIAGATGNATFNNLYSLNVTTNENAETALDIVKTAIQRVDKVRTQIGSVINNLQAIWDGQKASYDNTKEAENVIRNTDFAAEMSTFTTMQIKMQSGMAMLAQANALPQLVLQLLR